MKNKRIRIIFNSDFIFKLSGILDFYLLEQQTRETIIKMKILLTIQQYFGYLSISPSSEEFGFNLQHILTLILFLQFSLASIAYFLFTATQLLEYVDCFYALITVPLNIITFSSNVRNSPIIFKLIDGVEAAIQKRELFSSECIISIITRISFHRVFQDVQIQTPKTCMRRRIIMLTFWPSLFMCLSLILPFRVFFWFSFSSALSFISLRIWGQTHFASRFLLSKFTNLRKHHITR